MANKRIKDLFNKFDATTENMLIELGIDPNEIYDWRKKYHELSRKEDSMRSRYLATQQKHLWFCIEFAEVIHEVKEALKYQEDFDEPNFYFDYFGISRPTFYRYYRIFENWEAIREHNPTSVNHALNILKQEVKAELDLDSKLAQNKQRISDALTIENLVEQVADLKAENEEMKAKYTELQSLCIEQGEQMKVLIAELSMYRSLEKSKPSLE